MLECDIHFKVIQNHLRTVHYASTIATYYNIYTVLNNL